MLDSLKDKAKFDEMHVKVLEGLLMVSEACEAKFKDELEASKGTIQELEARMKEKDEKIAKGEEYNALLEVQFADATHKGMVFESWADTTIFK